MDNDSTVANNQDDADTSVTTGSDAADSKAGDNANNQDTSQSTDTTGADDKSTNEGKDDTSALTYDTDLDDWAVKSGRQAPTTDGERALLQELRNNSREFTRGQQSKKSEETFAKATTDAKPEVEDDDDDADPLEKDMKSVKEQLSEERAMRMRGEYFNSNGVTTDEARKMGEILKEKSDKGGKPAFDYWSAPENIQDLHDLAKIRLSSNADTSAVADEAAQKERDRIAKESKANGSTRNATSTSTGTKTEDEERLERFSNWDPPKK